jgi:hypothetical protein
LLSLLSSSSFVEALGVDRHAGPKYQLDTSLSDAERYPLRQSDLVVLEVSPLKAPMVVQWGIDTSNRKNVIHDIPNLGSFATTGLSMRVSVIAR